MQIFNKNFLGLHPMLRHGVLGNLSIAYCYSKIFKTVFLFQKFSDDDIENVENIKKYEKSYVVFLKT